MPCPCKIKLSAGFVWQKVEVCRDGCFAYDLRETRTVIEAGSYAPVLTLDSYKKGEARYTLSCGCTAGGLEITRSAQAPIPWEAFSDESGDFTVTCYVRDPVGEHTRPGIVADQPPDTAC